MKIDRRRLLKGSLAAPVVLTVRPASATALTSATACMQRCETSAQQKRPVTLSGIARGDEWMRVDLDLYRVAPSLNADPYKGKFFLGFDQNTFWRLDERDSYRRPAEATSYRKGSVYAEKTGERMYAIAYVNKDSKISGFAWENPQHGSRVTWSCYTSAVGLKHNA